MKHTSMRPPLPKKPPNHAARPSKPEAAFDLWLNCSLHQMFDDVAQEPIPDELLRLIEDDRKK